MRRIRFHQPHKRLLVYGHYPASLHNLKQLKRRHSTAAVVMPVRPWGPCCVPDSPHPPQELRPLDLRCPGLTDGIPNLHQRSESDLFHLLGILYLPQIHLLIRSWIEATKTNNIPLFFVPFENITEAQSELLAKINSLLPKDYKSAADPKGNNNAVKVNMSTTRKIKIGDIGFNQRESVEAIATKLLGCDDNLGALLPYLLSDLQAPAKDYIAPLTWEFNSHQ